MSTGAVRSDIQGLRAIAVLAVIAFHFNPAWLPGGFIGVDVFLVISGFLITSILLKKKEQVDYTLAATLKHFYSSRCRRIVPAYYAMLVLVALVAAVFFLPQDFEIFKAGLESAIWFNSNSYFSGFGDYFAPASYEQPLLHTWSLAVEIQFYLLAPLLVLLLPVNALKWLLWVLLLGLTLFAEYRLRILGVEQATYYSLSARLPEFFAGGLAALYMRGYPRGWSKVNPWLGSCGLGLITLSAIVQPTFGAFPGFPALLPVIGSVMVLLSNTEHSVSHMLSNNVLVWLGALSYSLYLWHWPVLAFLRYYTGSEVLGLQFGFLFFVLTFSLSLLSRYLIERPMQNKSSPPKKQAIAWGAVMLIALGTSQVATRVSERFTPEQLPVEYMRYADSAKICHGKIVGECLLGDRSSSREILVLGDSHAAMLTHFYEQLGQSAGFKARVITASSCVTIPGFDYERIPHWARQPCMDQIEEARKYISAAEAVFVAGMWSYQTQSEAFNRALHVFLRDMKSQGKAVYIMPQVAQFDYSPQRARRFHYLGMSEQVQLDMGFLRANDFLRSTLKGREGVVYLELDSSGLFAQAPFYRGDLIYFDEHHLNEVGAVLYGEKSRESFISLTRLGRE